MTVWIADSIAVNCNYSTYSTGSDIYLIHFNIIELKEQREESEKVDCNFKWIGLSSKTTFFWLIFLLEVKILNYQIGYSSYKIWEVF